MSSNGRSATTWWLVGGLAVAALIVVPLVLEDDDADASDATGFDAYIQSGTCAAPTDDLRVGLESEDGADDVEPYAAVGDDGEPVTLGYYGAPELPGLSVATIYTDQELSMVIADVESGEAVACGEVLRPQDDRYGESGLAVVQLLGVGSSEISGVATLERTSLQRELDITPSRARIILSADQVTVPEDHAAGYEASIRSGRCDAPADDVAIELDNEDGDHDVRPFEAVGPGSSDSVTVAYYGAPGAPGFGVAATYTEHFSMVLEDPESGEPVACGDILEPDSDQFTEAGLVLVQLVPTGDAGVSGYAVLDRVTMQRELDVTPTLVRIVLFAAPVTDEDRGSSNR